MVAIQKVRHKIKRNTVIALLLGAAGGAGLIFILDAFIGGINHWLEYHALFLVEHHYLLFLIMLVLVSPLLVLSLSLLRLANKVVSSQRFPPPQTAVIKDIRIQEGRAAVRKGRLLQLLCWLILLASSALPLIVWFIFYSISGLR